MKTVAQLNFQNLKDITAQDIARQTEEQAAPPKIIHTTFNGEKLDLIEDVWLFEFAPFDEKTEERDNRFAFNRIRGYYTPILDEQASKAEHLEYKPVYLYFDSALGTDENKLLPRRHYLNEIFSRPEICSRGVGTLCVYCRKEDIDLVLEKMDYAVCKLFDSLRAKALEGLEYFMDNKEDLFNGRSLKGRN